MIMEHMASGVATSSNNNNQGTPQHNQLDDGLIPLSTGADRLSQGTSPAAPSPSCSPQGKTFGRNINGTMVVTGTPSNEAELQIYRVLQRASLLSYYDTLLDVGGEDVRQFCDAGEEEFLEIMSLVGMASKPLHVRRFQKVLHEWVSNPSAFQTPISNSDTSRLVYSPEPVGTSHSPISTTSHQHGSSHSITSSTATSSFNLGNSSNIQLTPSLTESQISRLTISAERLSQKLPQPEPRQQNSKKRSSRELEQVMAMNESDPRRMDEIRKYAAIYGRFDCKRRPEKPLTLHEVCVNEAAAQICKYIPALLTRRDELFPLARQVVRDSGFGHSASISRFVMNHQTQHSDEQESISSKRARLSSDASSDLGKEAEEILNTTNLYQRLGKQFNLTSDINKFPYSIKQDYDDQDDSRFSFSDSNSSPIQGGGGDSDNMTSENNESEKHHHLSQSPDTLGIKVISSSGGHIIAVANPALAMSPALTINETICVKREVLTPDI